MIAGRAGAETRVALVIGNAQYRHLPALANPGFDAKDIGADLQTLGFKVSLGIDLDLAGMERAISAFAKAAAEADVSLVYYSGHGVQVAGHNYLIPVDAELHDEQDIYKRTVHFDDVMKALQQAKGLHLLFLDACRTNPVKDASPVAHAQGLARVGDAANFLIAFATQPDNVAYDGAGRNSPFAQALLSHLSTTGQDVSSMMIEVRKDVIATTGGAQIPWENSSLTRQFYFAPGEVADGSSETLLWRLGAGQKDASLLRIYLDRYPEGAHVGDAKALLAEIGRQGKPNPAPAKNENVEDLLWRLAKSERQRPLLELYLARYPSGAHRPEAEALIERLPDSEGAAPPAVLCQRLATHPRDATADYPGVELETLARNADLAMSACREAAAQHPGEAHYVALLARATAASGKRDEAIGLYQQAAEAGDARAMVSLGLLYEAGDGLPKDLKAADELYAKAASRGSADGAINLAVALMKGAGIERDTARAVSLLKTAAAGGSAIATYDLGVLAQQGVAGDADEALDFFRRSAALGDPRGHVAAAILLDEGRGVAKNPEAAADQLLRGVAADSGEAFSQLTAKAPAWSRETIKAVEARLKSAGYYSGPVDGRGGAALAPALKQWRLLGPPQKS
ncbi:MAG TPA: caspase family protein [Roseiarcus sp.]|nr:caspase family protein [Roseiarcus sp.]